MHEGINFRFELLFFTVLAQSVAGMIAVGPTGRWRSTMTALTSFWVFFAYKNVYAELSRELARGSAFSRYEQFETFPETIEQELRPVVC